MVNHFLSSVCVYNKFFFLLLIFFSFGSMRLSSFRFESLTEFDCELQEKKMSIRETLAANIYIHLLCFFFLSVFHSLYTLSRLLLLLRTTITTFALSGFNCFARLKYEAYSSSSNSSSSSSSSSRNIAVATFGSIRKM